MGSETESRIRARAYLLWEESGRPDGMEHEHWVQAEREIAGDTDSTKAPQSRTPPAPPAEEAPKKRAAKPKSGRS